MPRDASRSETAAAPVMIMAGGTGGHVYPALAVADCLRRRGVPLYWLGTRQGLEARIAPAHDFPLLTIEVRGLRGKGIGGWLLAPLRILAALFQALRHLLRCRPAAVLGMGGFASGPGGIAAWMLRIPLLIHEQNAAAGLTNRLLAPFATLLMEGFAGTFSGRRVRTTGNPVREDIAGLEPPAQRLAGRGPVARLLVVGGSQGARALNEKVPGALALLGQDLQVEVLHQCGPRHLDDARRCYAAAGMSSARVVPYIEDMAAAYAWADLVLCRAGALTIAELCVAGIASVLVPYPFAADDHQTVNARHLSERGCAVLVPEPELDAQPLASLLNELFSDRQRLLAMAECCRAMARPQAASAVADACLEAARA